MVKDVEVRLITAVTILRLWLSMNIICRSPFFKGLGAEYSFRCD